LKSVVRMDKVSKEYRLGVSRTSLLEVFSSYLNNLFKYKSLPTNEEQVIWALRNISFELSQGDSLGLIGRNGAGKSTLLKLLANITRPTSGQIEVDGRVSALIELGSGFHPDLTGRENIFLNGTILGLARNEIRHRFDEIVAFSELERFIDTPVKRYSSGMTVRLGFAVAACIEPDILLVDEVLAVGDASFRLKCLNRIQSLINKGTSIVFVSHNLYMVQAICPTSIYIDQGQIKYQGRTADAIDAYESDLHREQARKLESERRYRQDRITDVQITQVEVVDAKSEDTPEEFYSQQSVKILVHFFTYRSGEEVNAVVRIVRTDGVTCCMMRTSHDGVEFCLGQGEGVITVELDPLQLTGGTYFIDARLTNATDSVILSTASSKWFYVSGTGLSHEEQSGVYIPNKKWDCYQIEPQLGKVHQRSNQVRNSDGL
jgi:lipopolysaccharide transport system ATP-binding protein